MKTVEKTAVENVATSANSVGSRPAVSPRKRGRRTSVEGRWRHVASRPRHKQSQCLDKLALTWLPRPVRATPLDFNLISSIVLLVHTSRGDEQCFEAYTPRREPLTNRVVYDAATRQASYQPGIMTPDQRLLIKACVALADATDTQCTGQFLPYAPKTPQYWFASDPRSPLQPELGNPWLLRAARELAQLPETAVPSTEARLRAFRDSRVVRNGVTCYPQEFFVRAASHYVEHPVSGSPVPAYDTAQVPVEGTRDVSGDWVFHEATWTPVAQTPLRVYADFAPVRGRLRYNPAFSALKSVGLLPAEQAYQLPEAARVLAKAAASDLWAVLTRCVLDAVQRVTGAYADMEPAMLTPEVVERENTGVSTDDLPRIAEVAKQSLRDVLGDRELPTSDEELMAVARDPRLSLNCVKRARNELRRRLGGVSNFASDAAVDAALAAPYDQLETDLEACLQVIQLEGPCDADTATFASASTVLALGE